MLPEPGFPSNWKTSFLGSSGHEVICLQCFLRTNKQQMLPCLSWHPSGPWCVDGVLSKDFAGLFLSRFAVHAHPQRARNENSSLLPDLSEVYNVPGDFPLKYITSTSEFLSLFSSFGKRSTDKNKTLKKKKTMRRTEVSHFVFTESQRKSLALAFCFIFPFSPPSPKACVFLTFHLFQIEQFWVLIKS